MDLTTISAALGALKTATEIAKFFRDNDDALEKAEAKLKLAELISALAEAKIQISDIQQAMAEKDIEIKELIRRMQLHADLKWEDPYYWQTHGEQIDGPFCQPCYDKDKRIARLSHVETGHWSCQVCNQHFYDRNYSEPGPTVLRDYDPLSDSQSWMG